MKVLPTLGSMYSGSLRGITASHNKGGLYLRGRTVPTNPDTARQTSVRGLLAAVMTAWNSVLTEAQRQSWRDWAEAVPFTDSLGQSMTLSGVNAFVRFNVPWLQEQLARTGTTFGVVADAPTFLDNAEAIVEVTNFSIDTTVAPGTVTMQGQFLEPIMFAGRVVLYVSAPRPPGVRFFKGPYQLAASAAVTAGATNFAISADVSDAAQWFSSTVPVAGWDGLFVPVRVRLLTTNGLLGPERRELIEFSDIT